MYYVVSSSLSAYFYPILGYQSQRVGPMEKRQETPRIHVYNNFSIYKFG